MKQKLKYWSICFLSLFLLISACASPAFAAGGALGADRNGTPYTYVIGYMYSGSSQTVNTREIFTSPNNYDIWLCPVCGRDPLGNSQGTALSPNLYMPCYGYDIAATGGDMSIRYALVRHRHNNGQLSNDRVYIPVNVPMYAGCYYGYDLTEPAGVQVSAPTGWQRDSAVVRFSGGTDTGTSLPDWSAAPGDYGSGIHHYEYSVNGGAWTGCPVGDPTVTITAGGITTVTARVVDGAGNASGQTATAKVYIDPAPPNVPGITLSTEQWTNSTVTAAIKDNGDAHSGVARTEYSLDGGSWTAYSGVLSIADHGKHTVSARAIDNVGRVSGTASKTALVDKVAPVISKVEQQPDSGHTEMTLAVTATDADSGVKGYAVTTEEKAPALDKFQDSAPKADHNGVYYIWAADKAGNISAAAKVNVTALDIVSHMIGAQIDYVITNVDRAGNCAVASRRRALELRRNRFKYARRGNQPGDHVMVNVLIVGPKLMRVECWGHDMLLTPRSLTYASVADLREEYHSGQQLEAVIKEYDPESDDLRISVKEVNPNPFDDADIRHPVGSECRAIIGGRYRGGVFCRLPDDVTCMCLYSNIFTEYDCSPGDAVLVRITHYDYANKHVYGRIVLRL